MICYNGEDLPKPLALIGAPFVGKVEKGTLLDVLLYGRVFASIFCGLYGERRMLVFLRVLERSLRCAGLALFTCFLLGLSYERF